MRQKVKVFRVLTCCALFVTGERKFPRKEGETVRTSIDILPCQQSQGRRAQGQFVIVDCRRGMASRVDAREPGLD